MTQPNFLQVQTSLDRAVAFVDAHPGLSSSERYGDALRAMRARFFAQTKATDERYTEWRGLRAAENTQYRDVKRLYDEVVELADEHGYDDVPRQRVVYTDEEHLNRLVDATIAWIDSKDGEWDWLGEKRAEFLRRRAEAESRRAAHAEVFHAYTVEVKRRVTAYDDAVALIREYLTDAAREGRQFESFAGLQLDVL